MRPVPTVRPAIVADIPRIVLRWKELIETHVALDPQLFALADHAPGTYGRFIRRQLDEKNSVVLVAPHEDDLAGYLVGAVGHRAPVFAVREVGMIFDLAVRPDLRRQGFGRALFEGARDWFRRRNIEWMQVSFAPGNPASSTFWPGLDFRVLLQEGYRPID